MSKVLWSEGLERLRRLTGQGDGAARKMLGRLTRDAGGDMAGTLQALRDCPDTGDPISWLRKAAGNVKARHGRKSAIDTIRDDWDLPTLADPRLLFDDEPPPGTVFQ